MLLRSTGARQSADTFWQRPVQLARAFLFPAGGTTVISKGYNNLLRWPRPCTCAGGIPMAGGLARTLSLSLQRARVCLDCDCLTDEQSCPWCDRAATVPLAGWFRPIEDAQVNATRHEKTPVARQWILIVQHHQRDLYRVLRQALAGTGVEVLYERRVGQRRRTAAGPSADERRRTDRRRPRPSAAVYQDSAPAAKPESPARPGAAGDRPVGRPRRRRPPRSSDHGSRRPRRSGRPHTSGATASTRASFRRWSSA